MRIRILTLLCSIWFICAIALAARLGFLWYQQHAIPHDVLASVPFAQETGNIAYALANGKGFVNVFRQETGPTAWLTPVYPLLIAAIFRLFGSFTFASFLVAVILNSVFSAATCVPIYYTARRIANSRAAVLAAWLWALFPNAVMVPIQWIWSTSLAALLAALLLWLSLEIADSSRAVHWLGYGCLWGLALLTEPALGALLPFLMAWLVYRSPSKKLGAWKFPVLSLAIVVLCCLPWTIRNYSAFHHFIPLRSNFAFELWIGNNDIFDPHAIHGIQRITRLEQSRRYTQLGETAFMEEKWRMASDFIRTHPALEVQLTARRITATWLGTEHPLADFLSTNSLLARMLFICNFLLLVGTVAGMLRLFLRCNACIFPVIVFPVVFPVVHYLTHTSLRYRHPIDPVLMILTAIAFFVPPHSPKPSSPL